MRKRLPNILLALVFAAGLGLLLYPTLADYWNSLTQTAAISAYSEQAAGMDEKEKEALFAEAEAYNRDLAENGTSWNLSKEEEAAYYALLNVDSNGVMGYIEIPKISVALPIYHGTGSNALSSGAGHFEGSSLPVGGESTHAVLTGHRGLVSARLFTDLDKLEKGDTFTVTVLDRVLTYEIDRILTVLPEELDALTIREGEDLCTLVTCTPYGVNTHRLLLQGRRTDNAREKISVSGDALVLESSLIAPLLAVPVLLVLLFLLLVSTRRKR